MTSRLLRRLLRAAAVMVALVAVYGVMVEPRLILDEERHRVVLPRLPNGASVEVALFSDLQVGMWLANEAMARRVVDEVVEAQPDAVLYAGDFLYSSEPDVGTQVERIAALFAPIVEAGVPTYAVLGNHDYAVGAAEALDRALSAAGITVLRNDSATVPGTPLHVVGLGPETPERSDPEQALAGVPASAPRVVLMHNPTTFPELPAGTAPLAVAGHTHCGQVVLPGSPTWGYVGLTDEEARVADGFAEEGYGAPGNSLFVTCGIGFSMVPARINAAPQLVFFTLVG